MFQWLLGNPTCVYGRLERNQCNPISCIRMSHSIILFFYFNFSNEVVYVYSLPQFLQFFSIFPLFSVTNAHTFINALQKSNCVGGCSKIVFVWCFIQRKECICTQVRCHARTALMGSCLHSQKYNVLQGLIYISRVVAGVLWSIRELFHPI